MSEIVLVETVDRVCTVTLNRPEARNALDTALQRASAAALAGAEANAAVDVVILTGRDPAFCAGLDLRELGSTAANLVGSGDEPVVSPFTVLWRMAKPVIGAINGPAVTGGFELALACDFLVASERASFADTHARVGVTPGGGMSVFLPQAVGLRRAKEMSLTGNFVDAAEAHALGLVNHVVAHDDLLPAARRLATDIAGNDQHSVRNLKRLYDRGSKVAAG
ncbi:MAG TPA: enoyl-CoA hydratase, partial [Acidimicrobiia bacterium]